MTRKLLTTAIAVAALLVSVLSFSATSADAQVAGCTIYDIHTPGDCAHWYYDDYQTCPYYLAVVNGCEKPLVYTGPFTVMPPAPVGPYGWGALNIVAAPPAAAAATDAAAPAAGAAAPLAHTGSESAVLGYVGAGLVAFGAVALGSRRKFFQGTLD